MTKLSEDFLDSIRIFRHKYYRFQMMNKPDDATQAMVALRKTKKLIDSLIKELQVERIVVKEEIKALNEILRIEERT